MNIVFKNETCIERERYTFFNKDIDFLIDAIYHIRNKNEIDNAKAVII